ncbi:hypothetical protein ACFQ9Z_38490 [Streptomyces sp. NPDC056580]|uniref:hypothetical protein n=1 Tax=Streptomyces sp. NPDC056580 TaxID=3345872 RepID=UPI0036A88C11
MPSELRDEWRDVIVRYPMETTPEETSKVETFIRASFGAMEGAREERGAGAWRVVCVAADFLAVELEPVSLPPP